MEAELYALPIVERVIIGTRALPGDTVVYTTVNVQTRRRLGYEVGGTISSTRCLEVGAAGRDRFAFGGPRMATLALSFSNLFAQQVGGGFPCAAPVTGAYAEPDYGVSLELVQPWAFTLRTSVQVRAFARRETAPPVYVQRGFGGEVGITHELGRTASVGIGWAPRRDELHAVGLYFCANYALCEPEQVAPFATPRWLAPVQLSVVSMTPGYGRIARPPPAAALDWLPRPVPFVRLRGTLTADGAASWTGSDYTYGRVQGTVAVTGTVTRDIELAARARVGAIAGSGVLPPQLRLFSGGVVSVRGVPHNMLGPMLVVIPPERVPAGCAPVCDIGSLDVDGRSVRPAGGDRLAEVGVEARLWVGSGLQLAAFVDYGILSRRDPIAVTGASVGAARASVPGAGAGAVSVVVPDAGVRAASVIAPGVGVRVLSPMGPIRIDLAYDPRPPRRYPVFSEDAQGRALLVGTGIYDPFTRDGARGFREFRRRLQLQLAVGQPF
jgi:outer membrane protein assembly factor BamA